MSESNSTLHYVATVGEEHRIRRLRRTAAVLGLSGPIVFVVSVLLAARLTDDHETFFAIEAVAFLLCVIAISTCVLLLALAASPSAPSWILILMTLLTLLAPIAAVLTGRLSYEICIILNPFFLPWPDAVKTVVRAVSAAVILASTAGLITGLTRRELRGATLVLVIYTAIIAIPTFLFFFLTVYGDPGPECVVG